MGILTKKIYRDIRYNKGRAISIVSIILIATGLYGGLLLTYNNVSNSFDTAQNDLNMESVRISLLNFTDPSDLDFDQFEYIEAWDYRISVLSSIKVNGGSVSYTAPIYGIESHRHPRVNDIMVMEGDYLTEEPDQILITEHFVDSKNLEIGDNITLFTPGGTSQMKLQGEVFSPEFLYSVNPKTGLPDLTGLAPSWMDIDALRSLFFLPNGVNELVIRFNEETRNDDPKFDQAKSDLRSYLETNVGEFSLIELEEEPDQKMKNGDLEALDDFARIFGLVVMIIALFAIYDNISKLIANQRNYIGTMRALGGSKMTVTSHYTKMATLLALVGVFLGGFLAWGLSTWMTVYYADLLGIPTPDTGFLLLPVLEGVIVNFILALIIALLSSLRASGIQPREAMSSAFIAETYSSKPLIEKITSKLPGLNSPSSTIALRNIFRNKKKTLITIFTFAISLTLMISAMSFMDSFNGALNQNFEDYRKYDMEVYFEMPLSLQQIQPIIDNMDKIQEYEGFLSTPLDVKYGKNVVSSNLYGFLNNTNMREFGLRSGSTDGLLIGEIIADDLGVDIGDSVNIFNTSFEIHGISGDILAENVYLPLSTAQSLLHMGENITGIILKHENGIDVNRLKEELHENLPVSVVISMDEVKFSIEYLIQGLIGMIYVMIFIGFVTVALFSFNTIVLEIISREVEFVNLRSLGASNWKLAKIILLQSLMVSIIGSIIAIPLGYVISDLVLKAMISGLMVMDTIVLPKTYLFAIVTAMFASLTGIVAAYRHVVKINLVEALRTRINN